MLLRLQKTFLLLFILCSQQLIGQVKFTATLSPNLIGKNDFTQLKLLVENGNNIEKIIAPDFKDFDLQSGPNEETGMTSINGNVKKYYAQNYILKPKTNGTFTIPFATAIVDGVAYKSNAVVVKVSIKATLGNNASPTPLGGLDIFAEPTQEPVFKDYILKKGENIAEKIKRNMFVRVDVNKTSCFVGEPIVATYKLFTRLKSESSITKNPSFNGFSVVDMEQPNALNYTTEKINGREYNVYTIRKTQLYPLQAGTFVLEEAEVENTIHFIKEDYLKNREQNFFNDFGQTPLPAEAVEDYKIILKNNAVNITVKPIPTVAMPSNFKGAVGHFTIDALLEKNSFTTDETAKLKVVLSGEGNLHLLTAPEIKWPSFIETYEPKFTEDLFKTTVPISGTKTAEYPFTTDSVGSFTLDTISFSFFDTKTGQYKTIYTRPIHFTVTKGTGKKQIQVTPTDSNNKNWLSSFFASRKMVIGVIAVLLLCVLFFWLKRDERKTNEELATKKNKEIEENELQQKMQLANKDWLSKTKNCIDNNDETNFYTVLNEEVNEFMLYKTGLDKSTSTKKNIVDWLDENKVSVVTANQYQQLINELETYLYNPFAQKKAMQEMYNTARDLVAALSL
jgi:BatD DUF11 like domain